VDSAQFFLVCPVPPRGFGGDLPVPALCLVRVLCVAFVCSAFILSPGLPVSS
jgi:hypothetical protein